MESEQKPKRERKPNAVKAQEETGLIKMRRDGVSADVHPNEVEHMKQHGWS